ncbi:MAG: hypothetical protein ACFKPT_25145 [Gloeotrichia echinulata GP01]
MKIDINTLIAILSFAFALLAMVYRIARSEAKIYEAIDSHGDAARERMNDIDKAVGIQAAIYEERKEWFDYLIRGLNEKIDHKFNRMYSELKELEVECKSKK